MFTFTEILASFEQHVCECVIYCLCGHANSIVRICTFVVSVWPKTATSFIQALFFLSARGRGLQTITLSLPRNCKRASVVNIIVDGPFRFQPNKAINKPNRVSLVRFVDGPFRFQPNKAINKSYQVSFPDTMCRWPVLISTEQGNHQIAPGFLGTIC